jgi:hypothetical protein
VEQTRTSCRQVKILFRKVVAGAVSQMRRRSNQLKSRYGPWYTRAMLGAAFVALFSPLPGSVLAAVTLIVVIAEVHRAITLYPGIVSWLIVDSWRQHSWRKKS